MRKSDTEKIVLQASGQGKAWLGCSSLLFFGLGVGLTMAYGLESGAYCFFLLIASVVLGLMDNSKESNVVLTRKYLYGGTTFRKSMEWGRLGKVWAGQYDIHWEGIKAKGGKSNICKTAYGNFGRECQHNQRHVSIDLAIEWIEALRDALSDEDRQELIRRFKRAAPQSERSIASLSPEEQAKANKLLKELKSWSSGYRQERKMEIRQYFANKGWAIPPTKHSTLVNALVYFYLFLLIPGCLFIIFYILVKYCLA
ncbi:MAG: hypothetical protein HN548_00015 [Opitutae bacterium]|nr:hypothetical protein [Opitutae bacterium]MBT5717112.1 hypothetical protein [Opitutae bacterium]